MSTTSLIAADVMNRSAALMNDPALTDYTYVAQLPYLNMAIDELVESLEESNAGVTNQTSTTTMLVLVGVNKIVSVDDLTPGFYHYPADLVEIQEVRERTSGSSDPFILLTKKEFLQEFPPSNSLMYWVWENQEIKFNPNGALTDREIQLKYVRQAIAQAVDENSIIGTINARSYLAYKTAALCSMFIGENETRAGVLEGQAEKALERVTGINNKGKQQIMTRHRPFRASYKSRGF